MEWTHIRYLVGIGGLHLLIALYIAVELRSELLHPKPIAVYVARVGVEDVVGLVLWNTAADVSDERLHVFYVIVSFKSQSGQSLYE